MARLVSVWTVARMVGREGYGDGNYMAGDTYHRAEMSADFEFIRRKGAGVNFLLYICST